MRLDRTSFINSSTIQGDSHMVVKFELRLCDLNPYCPTAKACSTGALHINRKAFRPALDDGKCNGYLVCVPICQRGAVAAQD